MDFTLKPEWEDLRTQVRNFIGDEVLYLEEDRAHYDCLLYTSPSPRDATLSRMPSSA